MKDLWSEQLVEVVSFLLEGIVWYKTMIFDAVEVGYWNMVSESVLMHFCENY